MEVARCLALLLLVSCAGMPLERPDSQWRAENLLVFVGEKVRVEERALNDESERVPFDTEFDAQYRVLDVVYGSYDEETLNFVAWNHSGQPKFANSELALLYVARTEQGFALHKYIFQPVYPLEGGGWAGCGDPYQGTPEEYRGEVKAAPQIFDPQVRFQITGLTPGELAGTYPPAFFEYSGGDAICKAGASVEGLFEVMRDGHLAARGVFGRSKQRMAWRRINGD